MGKQTREVTGDKRGGQVLAGFPVARHGLLRWLGGMPEIRILPDQVANQIAAGEVVERPAAAVKELLENSLDAGATRIGVEFRHGGKSFLAIEDNGCGMTPDQALLALEPHATSKIRAADDLNAIRSFGFRGEALPSIASVSRFTLRTRPADAVEGTEVLVNAGKLLHQKETGMAPGTRIEVANLFHPVPARLKFLKTENTETAHITRLVRLYALAQPQVNFRLVENGGEVFRSPVTDDLLERVRAIWGRQLAQDLDSFAPVEGQGMRVWGLLGKPGVGRSTRQEMVTIVNGRPVDSRTLAYALVESYHTLLPKGRYPLAFLFLEIDPACVDVNVHPAKREIRFREEPRVRRFVIEAVLRHLEKKGALAATPEWGKGILENGVSPSPALAGFGKQWERVVPLVSSPAISAAPETVADAGKAPLVAPSVPPISSGEIPVPEISPRPEVLPETTMNRAGEFRLSWRWKGFVQDGWALFETAAGLVVLHPRAAQERVWYERILARFEESAPVSQRLLLPVPLEMEPLAANMLRERQEVLAAAGFTVEEFGRNFFRIEAVPDWLAEGEAEAFVRDAVAEMGRRSGELAKSHLAHTLLAELALEKVGQRGENWTEQSVLALVKELFLCRQPTTCPRGRPVFFELSRAELARRLGLG